MDHRQYERNTRGLWAMVLIAIAYGVVLRYVPGPTGAKLVDGALGVVLGLYICSYPAANTIDLIFLDRFALRQISSEWSGLGWLALNMLVLLAGWLVIVAGATRFVG